MQIMNNVYEHYDVVIIGGGLGGLVSGNYLAKAGKKVLLAEQHFQPGGCCTSFKRKGFTFDAGGHFFGSFGEKGFLRKIIQDLELEDKIKFKEAEPSDYLVFPDFTVKIVRDLSHIEQQLKSIFPDEEEGITKFLSYLKTFNYTMSFRIKDKTFREILDSFFRDEKIKAVFDVLLLYIGLPSKQMSAVAGIILFRDFILDGGYYPLGSMQNFSNMLAQQMEKFGGTVMLSTKVEKINIEENKVTGITLKDGRIIQSDYVISNADANQTFLDMIGEEHLEQKFVTRLKEMEPSVSHFNVYLGIKSEAVENLAVKGNTWYVPEYDIEKIYNKMRTNPFHENGFIHIAFPSFYDESLSPEGHESIFLTILAPFKNVSYWKEQKESLSQLLIERAEHIIPELSQNIVVKEISTPQTIYRYTLNSQGANYGWAMKNSQVSRLRLNQKSPVKGLYLAGHWTLPGAGLATVAQSGYTAAKMILEDTH
nr:NAD(P)/FAD-dependent oxidoreductase [uncultured Lachnoclostridium sp.]